LSSWGYADRRSSFLGTGCANDNCACSPDFSLLLDLHTRGAGFSSVKTHASIDMHVYMTLPIGFNAYDSSEEYVLPLQKAVYGFHQAGLK
jgi:hypothetical protein